ncbi:MAG: AAA family ATPase [Acholeplasmatales bacterium]|nr:AAA family ATPase [Acholeplasmatales bacterium]
MLINFKVKNFMSFKDLQELSMVTGKVRRKDERTYKYKNFSLLKFSTIFGANASGKSNFVNALNIMRSIIIEEMPTTIKQYYYNLDDESKFTNTYFETELLIKDKCYSYGFEVNFLNNEIVEEWLLELIGDKVDIIFERSLPKNYIEIKRKFSKEISQKLNVYIADAKRDRSLLFLSFFEYY